MSYKHITPSQRNEINFHIILENKRDRASFKNTPGLGRLSIIFNYISTHEQQTAHPTPNRLYV